MALKFLNINKKFKQWFLKLNLNKEKTATRGEVICVWKPVGLSPLEAILRLKLQRPDLASEKITYAGRLDPLASGVIVLLVGGARFNKDQYLNLPKTYEVDILFGVSTDSGDVLGLIKDLGSKFIDPKSVAENISQFVGPCRQLAPKFSSPGLDGKTFYKEVEIYSIKMVDTYNINSVTLLDSIINKINLVTGDFRQAEILSKWRSLLGIGTKDWLVVKVVVEASSGTYMRVLAENIGAELGVPALAYSIKRTKVGDWGRGDCIDL
ncbi:MAG TPA: hypothetical protein VI752_00660 [Candidatus Paceibacterota bacterium]